MNISYYKMLICMNLFFAFDMHPSSRPQSKCKEYLNPKSSDPIIRSQRAKCLVVIGVAGCATTGYAAVACAANPAANFVFGSISGFCCSIATTMLTNNDSNCSTTQPEMPRSASLSRSPTGSPKEETQNPESL